jgi:LacI family transcriptional regulator
VPRRPDLRSPTLKQVARSARVSIKTVSRVLNSGTYVSDLTRRRVRRAIDQLGYRPNALARGLVTGRSRSIGLVIADIVNPFFPPLVRGIEDVAAARGYNLILCDTDEDPVRERAVVSVLLERQVDGLILCASRMPRSELARLAHDARHVVLVNRVLSHPSVGAVVIDNVAGARLATAHLLGLGHRRVAYLAGPRLSSSHRKRLRGYRQALEARGAAFDPRLVAGGTVSMAAGREAMAGLLRLQDPPTAVFAFDDLMAIGALEELRARGHRVPEDVAVVGFDDIDLAAFVDPPLTTVAQPTAEMGRLAANQLVDLIEGVPSRRARRVITLMPELVVRASCGFQAPPRAPDPPQSGGGPP